MVLLAALPTEQVWGSACAAQTQSTMSTWLFVWTYERELLAWECRRFVNFAELSSAHRSFSRSASSAMHEDSTQLNWSHFSAMVMCFLVCNSWLQWPVSEWRVGATSLWRREHTHPAVRWQSTVECKLMFVKLLRNSQWMMAHCSYITCWQGAAAQTTRSRRESVGVWQVGCASTLQRKPPSRCPIRQADIVLGLMMSINFIACCRNTWWRHHLDVLSDGDMGQVPRSLYVSLMTTFQRLLFFLSMHSCSGLDCSQYGSLGTCWTA